MIWQEAQLLLIPLQIISQSPKYPDSYHKDVTENVSTHVRLEESDDEQLVLLSLCIGPNERNGRKSLSDETMDQTREATGHRTPVRVFIIKHLDRRDQNE